MLKKELLKLIEKIEDEGSIDEVLSSNITLETFKEKVKGDKDFKAFLDSSNDKHAEKYLSTWKQNNLQKLIDEAVAKANPQETPEQKQIRELTLKYENMQKESLRKDLTNKAIKIATDKKIPVELVDYLIGENEETTTKNLEKLESVFGTHIESVVADRLKGSSYTPPKGDNTNTGSGNFIDIIKENQAKR
jgi:signal-transduction protein with cAMP-binding, CBS, and nucleotidyltransferase domain